MSVTNNGNSLKVLATVASTIYAFIEKHPNSWIVATGSTDARTRLYRMGITNNLVEISNDFYIFGYTKNEVWGEFIVGYDYEAFLVTKKQKIMYKTMIERLNKSKLPIITIDKNLEEKYYFQKN